MKFKVGDKVRLKSLITKNDLAGIGIGNYDWDELLNKEVIVSEVGAMDICVKTKDCGIWSIDREWFRPNHTGHQHTDIFKK